MSVRVLVVDDQEPFREAASDIVRSVQGFRLIGLAETGEDSVDASRSLRPDLVVMDVRLPGIDGIEAARRIREQHPETVVVLTSTYNEYEDDVEGCGAAAFILKDVLTAERLRSAWLSASP